MALEGTFIPLSPPRGEFLTSIRTPSIERGWDDIVEFRFAIREQETGRLHIAQPLTYKERDEEALPNINTRELDAPVLAICTRDPQGQAILRRMMDQLWALGIRPTDLGSPSQIAATEKHLGDLRAIVAKTLDVKLP